MASQQKIVETKNDKLYLRIVSDDNLTSQQKACHLTNLWNFSKVGHDLYLSLTDEETGDTVENIAKIIANCDSSVSWRSIYNGFADLAFSDNNINSYLNYAIRYPDYIEKSQYLQALASMIDFETDERRYTHNLIVLALWYTVLYFKVVDFKY